MLLPLYRRTRFLFLSILAAAIASPCQQRRDTSPDLFGSAPVGDHGVPLTLALAPTSESNTLFSDSQGSSSSIVSSPVDGFGSAYPDDPTQIPVSDSLTGLAFSDGSQDPSELLFPSGDVEGVFDFDTTENLVAQLPNFGGITEFSFKDPENPNLCPARGSPPTQSDKEKFPGPTGGRSFMERVTEEDKRKCPARPDGAQPVPLCCFSNFEESLLFQRSCWRC
jgi:hypothetical protein